MSSGKHPHPQTTPTRKGPYPKKADVEESEKNGTEKEETLGLQFYGIKRIATYLPDEHQFAVITELHDEYNGAPIVDTVAEDDQLVAEL